MNIKSIDKSELTFIDKFEENIKIIEHKTNLKRKEILIGLSTSLFLIWIGVLDIYISYLLTTFFPIKWTLMYFYKKDVDDDKQWLTYWVIFSFFTLLDMLSDYFITLIPFYFFIRTMFLLWLYLPNFKGALIVYKDIIVKLLKFSYKYELIKTKSKAKNTLKDEVEEIIKNRNIEREILLNDKN